MNKVAALILFGCIALVQLPGQSVVGRERRQQARIAQGARSGELTPAEAARLERKQARLRRQIRRDRVDGGGLSARERSRINRQQNQLNRKIYREKHDNQVAPR